MEMKVRRCFLISFTLLLIFLLLFLPSPITAQADSDETPGKITVDKYRSKYELNPGEKTIVTLETKINSVNQPKPTTTILALDMSGSMADDKILEPTLIAARKAAEIITEYNNKVTNLEKQAKIALVRYDSAASVYDFEDGKWVMLDSLGTVERLDAEYCYSSDFEKIDAALQTTNIASSTLVNGRRQPNNYPRKNEFYLINSWGVASGAYPNNITSINVGAYDEEPGIITYRTTDNLKGPGISSKKSGLVQGTNIEAGIHVTRLVAEKIKDPSKDVYPIFMTDGIPTFFQFGGTPSPSLTNATKINSFEPEGMGFAASAIKWANMIGSTGALPDPIDPARTLAHRAGEKLQAQILNPNSRIKNVYAIGVNLGFAVNNVNYPAQLSTAMRTEQANVLESLTGDRGSVNGGGSGRSFITSKPAEEITGIYESIAKEISADTVTSDITIKDEVPKGFTLTNQTREKMLAYAESLGGNVRFQTASDGVVTIIWKLGGLIPGKPLKLSYELTANYGSYGILNTNRSATLTYDIFCPGVPELENQDPNTKPIEFPIPQIKVQPVGGQDDHYVMPDNKTPYVLTNELVEKRNVVGLTPLEGQSIVTGGLIGQNDLLPKLVDDGADNGYDDRESPRLGDKVLEEDRFAKPLKLRLESSKDGPIGIEQSKEIGILQMSIPDPKVPTKIELRYTPNPTRSPDRGYRVKYSYRYESDEEDGKEPAYVSPWYTITIDVPPFQKRASVEFKKVGDGGKPLKDAVFGIYLNRGDNVASGDPIWVTTTDGSGMGYFDNLPANEYVIKEIEAPSEYVLNETCYPVTVSEAQQNGGAVVRPSIYPFVNNLKQGSITFRKVDQYGSAVEGVRFGLYRANDEDFILPVAEVTSEPDGKVAFTHIKPGKYRIKELGAPENYENKFWISDVIEITSINDQLHITLRDVVNVLIQPFDLEVTKIGEDGERLPGAGFSLKNDVTNQMNYVASEDNGKFTIFNLEPGIYYLKEIEAPTGYRLLTSEYLLDIKLLEQEVTLAGKPVDFEWIPGTTNRKPVLKLMIENKRMPELPKTGGIGSLIFLGTGSVLMVIGVQTINHINRKKKRREKV